MVLSVNHSVSQIKAFPSEEHDEHDKHSPDKSQQYICFKLVSTTDLWLWAMEKVNCLPQCFSFLFYVFNAKSNSGRGSYPYPPVVTVLAIDVSLNSVWTTKEHYGTEKKVIFL